MPCLPSPPRNKDQTRTNNQTKGRGHKEDTELTTDDPKHYKTRRPYHHHLKVVNHLQMTQKVIGRMAACSFAVKAFSLIYLLLGAAIIVEPLTRSTAVIAVYLPIVMMWWLDASFLRSERMYRKLFNAIRIKTDTNYSLSPTEFADDATCAMTSTFNSETLVIFYMAQLVCLSVLWGVA